MKTVKTTFIIIHTLNIFFFYFVFTQHLKHMTNFRKLTNKMLIFSYRSKWCYFLSSVSLNPLQINSKDSSFWHLFPSRLMNILQFYLKNYLCIFFIKNPKNPKTIKLYFLSLNYLQICRWTVPNFVGELSPKCLSLNCLSPQNTRRHCKVSL